MSIDILLRDTEALPLGLDVLPKMAGKGDQCRAIEYSQIEKAAHLSEILNETHPYAIILVMDKREPQSKIGHYVCAWLKGNDVFYFDSYAHRVQRLLALLKNSTALIKLVHAAGKRLVPNRKPVQQMSAKISTCGRHAAIRLRLSDWSHERYFRFMKSSLLNPD